jgi:hypothetical protein
VEAAFWFVGRSPECTTHPAGWMGTAYSRHRAGPSVHDSELFVAEDLPWRCAQNSQS